MIMYPSGIYFCSKFQVDILSSFWDMAQSVPKNGPFSKVQNQVHHLHTEWKPSAWYSVTMKLMVLDCQKGLYTKKISTFV